MKVKCLGCDIMESLLLSLSPSLRLNGNFFVPSARGTLSSITGKIATPRRRFRVRSAKYPFVRRARLCNSRAGGSEITSRSLLSVSLGCTFINFAAASPKNNIVERERNTDSRSLNRGSLIFHSRASPRLARLSAFPSPPLYR